MNFLDAIKTRRSIREFTDQSVSKEEVLPLLEAAMYAPSAHNEQPWEFVVVDDRNILDAVSETHQRVKMTKQVSIGVLVCANKNKDNANGFWVQDCSAATQNLLLAAHASEFWTVWTWIYPQQELIDKFVQLFNLPEHIIPFAFIPIWYPVTSGRAGNRFKEDKIHYNSR